MRRCPKRPGYRFLRGSSVESRHYHRWSVAFLMDTVISACHSRVLAANGVESMFIRQELDDRIRNVNQSDAMWQANLHTMGLKTLNMDCHDSDIQKSRPSI